MTDELRKRPKAASLVLVLGFFLVVATLAYLPGIRGGFLNFDDDRVALDPVSVSTTAGEAPQPAFQDNVLKSLGLILDPRRTIADVYYPVTTLSYYLDWQLWHRKGQYRRLEAGQEPLPYHLHNLLLHALVGLLLVLLLLDLGVALPLSLAATLPFLVHPAFAEDVVWIASRKDLLAGVFVLLALWWGRKALRDQRALWPVWGFAALACLSKGSALVLPLLAFLLWRPPFLCGTGKGRFRLLLGGVALISLVTALHQAVLASKAGVTAIPGDALAVPGTFLHYVGTVLWPARLAVHHPLHLREVFAQAAWIKAIWLVLILTAGLLLWLRGRARLPLAGLGILVFFVALLPYNNWIPGTSIAAADRYLYLPGLGLPLILAGIFLSLPRAHPRSIALGASLLLTLLLGTLAWRRSAAFHDSQALWASNLEVHPDDAVALLNLGNVQWDRAKYLDVGREEGLQKAIDLWTQAVEVADLPQHRFQAAVSLFRYLHAMGRIPASLEWGRQAVEILDEIAPVGSEAPLSIRIERIAALISADRLEDAASVQKEAASRFPDNGEVTALGVYILLDQVRKERDPKRRQELEREARARFSSIRKSRERGPWFALVQARLLVLDGKNIEATRMIGRMKNFGRVVSGTDLYFIEALALLAAEPYLASGDPAGAEVELRRGLQGCSISVRLRLALAPVYARLTLYKEAAICLRVARQIRPAPELDRALALALVGRVRGMVDKAQVEDYAKLVQEAGSLAPELPEVLWLRGRVLWGRKDRAGALKLIRKAHKASPQDAQILRDYLTLLKAMGYAWLLEKKEDRALKIFRELLDNTPPSLEHEEKFIKDLLRQHFEKRSKKAARVLLEQKFEEAIRIYESALAILPDEVGARFELGCAWLGKAKAISQDADARADLGRAEKNFRQALREAEKKEEDPAWMVLYLALTLQQSKRDGEARELLELYLVGVKKSLIRDRKIRERMKKLHQSLGG